MSKRILLIEDDAFVRDLYKTVLEKAGYFIVTASDGEEAIKVSADGKYDLVLLDIMLPKLTGIEVLKEFKQSNADIKNSPVYLLTNLGEENIANEAKRLGANGYLLKAKYLPKQLVSEIDKFFVSASSAPEINN